MIHLIAFGVACGLAIGVAACSNLDRRCLVTAALLIGGNWVLFAMPWIYAPASFAFIAHDLGIQTSQLTGWSIIELCTLVCLIGCCWRAWWSPMLWMPSLVNLVMYAVAYSTYMDYVSYQNVLDASLSVQLAVVFLIGGPGCADSVSRCWSVCSVVLGMAPHRGAQRIA